MQRNKIVLFTGLFFIALAFLFYWIDYPSYLFKTFLGAGVALKVFFLFNIFRGRGFKMSTGLSLILIGVTMICLSLLFKSVYPIPLLRNLLFYSAIFLKITGVSLLLYQSGK